MTDSQPLDSTRAELAERVRAARPENEPPEMTPLQKALAEINANWLLTARLPPPESASLRWRAVYFLKRVVRRVMIEALNTIVLQQNAFNANVARALTELAKDNARLRERVEELEKGRGNS
jgi:hypothetical protein